MFAREGDKIRHVIECERKRSAVSNSAPNKPLEVEPQLGKGQQLSTTPRRLRRPLIDRLTQLLAVTSALHSLRTRLSDCSSMIYDKCTQLWA
ncbi:hypothetical protein EVAR_39296_1 [Eumeta japonica]|uniref:Uncharacterized protein n=1 Tax=Eumeta variegata TaxID=151549 RepID=A0A4C1VVP4_EUMVA|nr:hypothetical protein EVAR_39296_1 [Eumeta japonica]